MYKLLVVDDEPIHRRELANLIRALRDNYDVSEADNGKAALEILSGCDDFNILVTDVKMPLMDGLELIEAMGERIDRLKVVVLSGYDYFDYAKRALKLGACDYILKPVDEEAVHSMLRRVESLIEKQKKLEGVKEDLQQQIDKAYPMYMDYAINRLLHADTDPEELRLLDGMIKRDGRGRVFALHLYGFDDSDTGIDGTCGREELGRFLRYTVHDRLKSFGHTLSFFLNTSHLMMAGILQPSHEEDASYLLQLENEFNRLCDTVSTSCAARLRIGVGNCRSRLFGDFRAAAREATDALDFGFYTGQPVVFYGAHPSESLSRIFIKNRMPEILLKDAIGTANRSKVRECFETAAAGLEMCKKPQPSIVASYIKDFLAAGLNSIALAADKWRLDEVNENIEKLDRCGDFSMLLGAAEAIAEQMLEISEDMIRNKNRSSVAQCLQYISEHLTEDISVEILASRFHFNHSYFSTIFKKNTGVGLSDYIFDVRMQKALQILKSSDHKVYEVAREAGFRDVKYFCKAFKSKFGVTPNCFRRSAGVGSAAE